MNDFQSEMNRVVQGFVAQMTELARRAALDMVENALGKNGPRGALIGIGRRGRGRGMKRTGAELDKLAEQFQTFVGKHPGLRIEQINKELGTTTKDLALPIRKLIADGTIKTKGKKRSTTYFAKGS
jgi:hypothetical protein